MAEKKKVKLNLEIGYGVDFPDDPRALELLMKNVADALENHVQNVGLAPEGYEVLTKNIKVKSGNWEVNRQIY